MLGTVEFYWVFVIILSYEYVKVVISKNNKREYENFTIFIVIRISLQFGI
jgi:hypothetical protein